MNSTQRNFCGATFHHDGDDREHRCFGPSGHDKVHHCICIDRGMPWSRYGPRYFDREGKPLPMCAWAVLFEDRHEYGAIGKTDVGPWWISTVWLGMDHQWGDGPPLIFETMVFWHGPTGSTPDQGYEYQERYSTEAQARAGHALAVAQCQQWQGVLDALDWQGRSDE
jgi:hypothetical protein